MVFFFETFKEDVCGGVVPLERYPKTLRRKVIEVAAKIVRASGRVILKIAAAVWDFLGFDGVQIKDIGEDICKEFSQIKLNN